MRLEVVAELHHGAGGIGAGSAPACLATASALTTRYRRRTQHRNRKWQQRVSRKQTRKARETTAQAAHQPSAPPLGKPPSPTSRRFNKTKHDDDRNRCAGAAGVGAARNRALKRLPCAIAILPPSSQQHALLGCRVLLVLQYCRRRRSNTPSSCGVVDSRVVSPPASQFGLRRRRLSIGNTVYIVNIYYCNTRVRVLV